MIDRMFNKDENEDELLGLDEESIKTMGTAQQTRIISNYPSQKKEDKLRIPHIEKQNGNLCIKSEPTSDSKTADNGITEEDEDESGKYRVAISFYNKALLALKMIFEGGQNNSVQVLDT